jgi:hypothetical protein
MPSRRISFSLPQLAAAAVLLMALSGGVVWSVVSRSAALRSAEIQRATDAARPAEASRANDDGSPERRDGDAADVQMAAIGFSDPQYDAAVADLEKAVHKGRGRLDANTIAIVEHNLQIIDQAIEQARQALAGDPANSYLSSHLFEARRRKLDLLRRAAALSTESD